jgi:hypothetical protein
VPPNPAPYVTSISVLVGREKGRVMDGFKRSGVGSDVNSEDEGFGDAFAEIDGDACDGEGDTDDKLSFRLCGFVGVVGCLPEFSAVDDGVGVVDLASPCDDCGR